MALARSIFILRICYKSKMPLAKSAFIPCAYYKLKDASSEVSAYTIRIF